MELDDAKSSKDSLANSQKESFFVTENMKRMNSTNSSMTESVCE